MAATRGGEGQREAIVAAAVSTVAAHGLPALRVRAVARDCGITHATLHYYFATKTDLVRAVVDDAIHARIAAPLVEGASPESPAARLRHLLAGLLERRSDDEHSAVMLELARHGHAEEVNGPLSDYVATWHRWLVDLIVDGVAAGEFRADLDPEGASGLIMHVTLGLQTRTPLPDGVAHATLAQLLAVLAPGGTGERGT